MMQGTWQLTIMAIMDVILTVNFLRTYMPRFVQNEFLYAVAVIILSVLMGVVYGYRNVIKIEKQAFVEDFYSRKSERASLLFGHQYPRCVAWKHRHRGTTRGKEQGKSADVS